MKEFKCRASAAGELLTNPRKGETGLSKTTVSYIETWTKEQLYGVRKMFTSKYTDKGISMEDEAIDKAIAWLDLPFAIKNEEKFEDEFFTGEPDLILEDEIVDIKNSWDCFTFPLFEEEIPNKEYEAQVQVYMHLTGKRKASVVYILLDTPETKWSAPISYEHISKDLRIKRYSFEYDPVMIAKLQDRVLQCRGYINQLITK